MLIRSMMQHRTESYRERLNWNAASLKGEYELDFFDVVNPLYLIVVDRNGLHEGSIRLLPTTGKTMTTSIFKNNFPEVSIRGSNIWEHSKLCLSPSSDEKTTGNLITALFELAASIKIDVFVGVVDNVLLSIFEQVGWPPIILSEGRFENRKIKLGLWSVSDQAKVDVFQATGLFGSSSKNYWGADLQNTRRRKLC